jgi:hypothetical protein
VACPGTLWHAGRLCDQLTAADGQTVPIQRTLACSCYQLRVFWHGRCCVLTAVIFTCQVAYHSGDIPGVDGNFANPPVKVKENLGSVIDAIRDRFHLEV